MLAANGWPGLATEGGVAWVMLVAVFYFKLIVIDFVSLQLSIS